MMNDDVTMLHAPEAFRMLSEKSASGRAGWLKEKPFAPHRGHAACRQRENARLAKKHGEARQEARLR